MYPQETSFAFRKRVEDSGQFYSWELPFGYFAVKLLADAWERAGSTDKDKAIAALDASTMSDHFMPYGPTKFTNGQNSGSHPVALNPACYPSSAACSSLMQPPNGR